jgi:sulfite exporter TauE/SafE
MNEQLLTLSITAATIGTLHTLAGPDHYLPFIALSKARKWSIVKTSWITALCGLGHVGSTILLGAIGLAIGFGTSKIESINESRGDMAAWILFAFGIAYTLWGVYRSIKNKPHKHFHKHEDGTFHVHKHKHGNAHDHLHKKEKWVKLTPWIIFIVFVLGPCESMIPLLMYPASSLSTASLILISGIFAVSTIVTMLAVVILAYYGIKMAHTQKLERHMHTIAGLIITLSAGAILFLGL